MIWSNFFSLNPAMEPTKGLFERMLSSRFVCLVYDSHLMIPQCTGRIRYLSSKQETFSLWRSLSFLHSSNCSIVRRCISRVCSENLKIFSSCHKSAFVHSFSPSVGRKEALSYQSGPESQHFALFLSAYQLKRFTICSSVTNN